MCIPETARKTLEELAGEDESCDVHDEEPDVREISKEPGVEEKIAA